MTARRTGRPARRRRRRGSAALGSALTLGASFTNVPAARRAGPSPAAPTTTTKRHGGDRHQQGDRDGRRSRATPGRIDARGARRDRHGDWRRRAALRSSGLNLGASFTNVPGGTASWTFSGGTNYNDQTGTAANRHQQGERDGRGRTI
jgi:hypothetical protein